MDLKRTALSVRAEQAVLVGVVLPNERDVGEPLEEIESLARTAGARVADRLVQKRTAPDPSYCLGKGKVAELKSICAACDADDIIFDHDL